MTRPRPTSKRPRGHWEDRETAVKQARRCPKCESENVIRIPGSAGPYGAGSNISIGITIFGSVKVSRYLCPDCGFLEHWVDAPEDVERIVRKYGGRKA